MIKYILFRFKTEKEAIRIANSVSVGLAGYFYSNDTRHSGKFKSATPSPESLPTAHA